MIESHSRQRTYLIVFAALAALTAIEVGVAALELNNNLRIIFLLGLAATKVVLVAQYYMHLKYDQRILTIIGAFPILLVAIMLLIFFADQNLGS